MSEHVYQYPTLSIYKKRTIVTEGLDNVVYKWLKLYGLHHFQWFFNGLSYIELLHLDESNLYNYLAQFRIFSISREAAKKICQLTQNLRNRPLRLRFLIRSLNENTNVDQLTDLVNVMLKVLYDPIPDHSCYYKYSPIKREIMYVMKLYIDYMQTRTQRVFGYCYEIGMVVHKFTECVRIITDNPVLSQEEIKELYFLNDLLKETFFIKRHEYKKFFDIL